MQSSDSTPHLAAKSFLSFPLEFFRTVRAFAKHWRKTNIDNRLDQIRHYIMFLHKDGWVWNGNLSSTDCSESFKKMIISEDYPFLSQQSGRYFFHILIRNLLTDRVQSHGWVKCPRIWEIFKYLVINCFSNITPCHIKLKFPLVLEQCKTGDISALRKYMYDEFIYEHCTLYIVQPAWNLYFTS